MFIQIKKGAMKAAVCNFYLKKQTKQNTSLSKFSPGGPCSSDHKPIEQLWDVL